MDSGLEWLFGYEVGAKRWPTFISEGE